jgi:hypothetical protein
MLFSSLDRQTYPYTLCMADEYAAQRSHVYDEYGFSDNTIFVECYKKPGNQRALAQAYNNAADLAVDFGFDLMVSLQDYIWIPDNGIEMFVQDHKEYPEALLTGLVSLSDAPSDQDIADPMGMYTIFKEPLTGRPEGISWRDGRLPMYGEEEEVVACAPEHWEANWAAIPVSILEHPDRWDLKYDEGVAYENMDFAKRAELVLKSPCVLDKRNHAVGIPHREIWPEEQKQLDRYTNRWIYEDWWGDKK